MNLDFLKRYAQNTIPGKAVVATMGLMNEGPMQQALTMPTTQQERITPEDDPFTSLAGGALGELAAKGVTEAGLKALSKLSGNPSNYIKGKNYSWYNPINKESSQEIGQIVNPEINALKQGNISPNMIARDAELQGQINNLADVNKFDAKRMNDLRTANQNVLPFQQSISPDEATKPIEQFDQLKKMMGNR